MSLSLCRSVPIPNHIMEKGLSSAALAAMVWFITKNHVMVDVDAVKSRFNWGTHLWQRVSKELRDNNLMTLKRSSTGGNRLYLNNDLVIG